MAVHTPVSVCELSRGHRRIRMRNLACFLHEAAHARPADRMLACYLRQRHAGAAVMHNLLAVNVESSTTDLASFEPCPAHARPDPLDNDATFEFRHRRHDDDDRPTQRTLCVYRLTLG